MRGGAVPAMSNRPDAKLDERVPVQVGMTLRQLREINQRAGLGPFDGRARSEYIGGWLIGEPEDELLDRVHRIRDAERVRFRAEVEAGRRERARRDAERRKIAPSASPHA
jgi:hypothetical protein